MTAVASVVERYYAVVADREGSADALRALLHPDVRIVEDPNAINHVHELLVSGDRVAVRASTRRSTATSRSCQVLEAQAP